MKEWWNEFNKEYHEMFAKVPEEKRGRISFLYNKLKAEIDSSAGEGSFTILLLSTIILAALIALGSGTGTAVLIGVATVYGCWIAIQRFPILAKFVRNHYKILDLVIFIAGFMLATTIFGFQVAAATGLIVTIALILWRHSERKDNLEEKLVKITINNRN